MNKEKNKRLNQVLLDLKNVEASLRGIAYEDGDYDKPEQKELWSKVKESLVNLYGSLLDLRDKSK